MSIWETIAIERRRLADELETLTEEQWNTQSQCDEWKVSEVAAHLVMPFEISFLKAGLAMLRSRGNLDKTMIHLTAKVHTQSSRADIVSRLRANADNRWTPPKRGAEIPLSEVVVHGQDIRRAVGLDFSVPGETVELALEGIDDESIRSDYARRIGH